jgi:hypothetical protein
MTSGGSADELREAGNQLFKDKQYLKAAAQYTAAIKKFESSQEELAVLYRYSSELPDVSTDVGMAVFERTSAQPNVTELPAHIMRPAVCSRIACSH